MLRLWHCSAVALGRLFPGKVMDLGIGTDAPDQRGALGEVLDDGAVGERAIDHGPSSARLGAVEVTLRQLGGDKDDDLARAGRGVVDYLVDRVGLLAAHMQGHDQRLLVGDKFQPLICGFPELLGRGEVPGAE
jgi:hypothetical protein